MLHCMLYVVACCVTCRWKVVGYPLYRTPKNPDFGGIPRKPPKTPQKPPLEKTQKSVPNGRVIKYPFFCAFFGHFWGRILGAPEIPPKNRGLSAGFPRKKGSKKGPFLGSFLGTFSPQDAPGENPGFPGFPPRAREGGISGVLGKPPKKGVFGGFPMVGRLWQNNPFFGMFRIDRHRNRSQFALTCSCSRSAMMLCTACMLIDRHRNRSQFALTCSCSRSAMMLCTACMMIDNNKHDRKHVALHDACCMSCCIACCMLFIMHVVCIASLRVSDCSLPAALRLFPAGGIASGSQHCTRSTVAAGCCST